MVELSAKLIESYFFFFRSCTGIRYSVSIIYLHIVASLFNRLLFILHWYFVSCLRLCLNNALFFYFVIHFHFLFVHPNLLFFFSFVCFYCRNLQTNTCRCFSVDFFFYRTHLRYWEWKCQNNNQVQCVLKRNIFSFWYL